MSLCYKCENVIDDDDDEFFECDSCDSLFHLKCANVLKKEINARKNSKCLRIYCPECFNNKTNGTHDKLKEIANVLYKLDLFNQQQIIKQQKDDDVFVSIARQISSLEEKVSTLEAGNSSQIPKSQNTYANAVKRSNVKPAVIIKPKNKQQSAQTLADISNKVDKSAVNVCGTRNARDGGVVLRCESSKETMKVKQLVADNLGDNYEVILPKIKSPRLRISNIDPDIEKDDILNVLKSHNPTINNIEMNLVTVLERKYRDTFYNDIVIEVNSAGFNQLIGMKKLRLPWRECRIFEHLYIVRCYKCCGFRHKSGQCDQSQICAKCSGPHKYSDCKSKNECCINCKAANQKYKLNIDTNHNAWSKNCQILKRHLSKLANKIEYNE